MLKFLPNHPRIICKKSTPPIQLPHHEADERGVVAVIDISGFTLLSARLFREHGVDGAAKLHEAINRPFEKIIRCVYARSGSIVKFAGDSAVVCWSSTATTSRHEDSLLQPLTCCLELLQIFHSSAKGNGSQSTDEDDVGIHIGVGFGRINHLYLGDRLEFQGSETMENPAKSEARLEYLIAGDAIIEAGAMLNAGTRGQVVLSSRFCDALVDSLPLIQVSERWLVSEIASILGRKVDVTIRDTDDISRRIVESELALLGDSYGEATVDENDLDRVRALRFLETSIARHFVQNGFKYRDFDDYSDLRNVAVVFVRFPGIELDKLSGSGNSETIQEANPIRTAQLVTEMLIASVNECGGSLRQVNFDDKSFTALAVWGLRGFAHHRSEAQYAIQACIDFAERIGRASVEQRGEHIGFVDIGVSSGTVYAGLIGNELRMDGTVLGATVNLAARLMCTKASGPDYALGRMNVRVNCDEASVRACQDEFLFDMSLPKICLKGFGDTVSIYPLLGKKEERDKFRRGRQVLFGRENEIELLDQAVRSWREGATNQRIFISGRSGFGKSALAQRLFHGFDGDSMTITCFSVAQETKHRTSFAFVGSMLRSLVSQLLLRDVRPNHLARTSSRASVGTQAITDSNQSLSIVASTADDAASSFLISAVCLVDKGGLGALGVIPGFRWAKTLPVASGDVAVTLSSFLAQLLRAVENLHFKMIIASDDGQWIDQESLRVLQVLMHLCPSILFLIVGRTREEWSIVDQFDALNSLCKIRVQLGSLNGEAIRQMIKKELGISSINDSLAQEIIEQSGGIPIALHLVLSFLKDHTSAFPSDKLRRRSSVLRKKLPNLSLDNAITAQIDSLTVEFRHIVSIASVIGQYFNVLVLAEVTKLCRLFAGSEEITVAEIRRMLENEDRFGFVTSTGLNDEYSFSHYLVHRGVLSAQLPQRREAIRRVLVHHLIVRFNNEDDDGHLLPTIVEHLMQLEGEKDLKSDYLHKAFISSAKARKPADAFYFRGMLDEINVNYYSHLSLTSRIQDCGFRAAMYFKTKYTENFLACAEELFRMSGASYTATSKSFLSFLIYFTRHYNILKSVQNSTPWKAREICAKYLTQTFPLAFPGKKVVVGKGTKAIHPTLTIDLLSLAKVPGEGLHRLDTIFNVLDNLCTASVIGRTRSMDFLYLQISMLLLAHLGEATEREVTFWLWRRKVVFLGLALVFDITGLKTTADKCLAAANFDPGPAVSLRALEYKAQQCLCTSLINSLRSDSMEHTDILLLREGVDYLKSAGVEYEIVSKSTWITIMWSFLGLGSFSPETEQDGVFRIGQLLKAVEMSCVDSIFILQIKCLAALEAALKSDLAEAELFIQLCKQTELSGSSLGFDEANKPTISILIASVLCLAMLLAERGKAVSESIELIQRFGVELLSHLGSSPSHLAQNTLFGSLMVLVNLLSLGLSVLEQKILEPPQRAQLSELALKMTAAVRKFARRVSSKIFFGSCCVKLSNVVTLLYRGKLCQTEAGLSVFLRNRDRRMPQHVHLMLQTRLIRMRRLRCGNDVVVPDVRALLKSFESFDNRCDPERLKMLCGISD